MPQKKKLEHVSEDGWAAPKILVEHSHQPFKVAPRAGITVRRIRITKTPASSTIITDIKIQPLARWRAQRWRSRRQSDCASGPGVAELRESEGGWWQAKGGLMWKTAVMGRRLCVCLKTERAVTGCRQTGQCKSLCNLYNTKASSFSQDQMGETWKEGQGTQRACSTVGCRFSSVDK